LTSCWTTGGKCNAGNWSASWAAWKRKATEVNTKFI
jgi:hypothetical protein